MASLQLTAEVTMTPFARLHVVVTCAQRKSVPVPDELHLRQFTGLPAVRARVWARALGKSSVPPRPALTLYAGEHWDIVRSWCSGTARARVGVDVWVCSAGYGLIPTGALVRPYAATFAPGQPDSVSGGAEGAVRWWQALSAWEGPAPGAPRSIAELVATGTVRRLLVVLSEPYLRACRADVMATVTGPTQNCRMSIISAGTKSDPDLAHLLLPVDARLQLALGGTRQALNVRVARHLIERGLERHEDMSAYLARLLGDQPPLPRYDRRTVSDPEVAAFVRRRLRTDPRVSHTRLLREFRVLGYACEQARFARVFGTETGESE